MKWLIRSFRILAVILIILFAVFLFQGDDFVACMMLILSVGTGLEGSILELKESFEKCRGL